MKTLTIAKPDDMHVHLRWITEGLLYKVLPWTAGHFGRAIVMPNLNDDLVATAEQAQNYRNAIRHELAMKNITDFQPLMTIKVSPKTTPEMLIEAKRLGVFAAKFYPRGVTTNSAGGISRFSDLADIYDCLQEIDMPALFHCEVPDTHPMLAEDDFIPILDWIIKHYPWLKIVVEHVSSKHMLNHLRRECGGNVGMSITAHHLFLTQEDVYGNPWNYCKPIAKTNDDRDALLSAVFSGNPRIWFGSDSAPHFPEKKTAFKPAAGIWTAPVALPLLAEIFDKNGNLDKLEYFVSGAGADWYGLPRNLGKITLVNEEWQIPEQINGLIPFLAGQRLGWQVKAD